MIYINIGKNPTCKWACKSSISNTVSFLNLMAFIPVHTHKFEKIMQNPC